MLRRHILCQPIQYLESLNNLKPMLAADEAPSSTAITDMYVSVGNSLTTSTEQPRSVELSARLSTVSGIS